MSHRSIVNSIVIHTLIYMPPNELLGKEEAFSQPRDQPETTTTCILIEISEVYVSGLRL